MDATIKLPDRKAVQADGLPVPRRYGAMLAMSIAIAVSVLDIAIANTALPTIAIDLQASPAASVWVVNAYQLALVVSLLPLAALGEIIGYRTIYMAGLALFTVASVACALSWSLPSLTAARVLQGFGASGIMSVNAALIRFIYPSRLLGRGIGFNTLIVAIFSALGPTVAAGILAVASWQWLFAVNLPLGIIALAVALPTLPYTARSTHRFDLISAALNAGAFGLLIVAIGEGAHRASALEVGLELAGAVLFGVLLVRRQAEHPAPLLPLDLFRRPIFALSALTAACSFATQGLAFVALPFYFQGTLGRSAVETGLLMTPWPVVVAIMAPIAGRLSDRYSAGVLGGIGLAILCLGMVLMALLPPEPSVLDICWRMALCGWGFGFFQAPNQKALIASAPPHRSGGASGIVAQARLLGQTIGAALVALCFSLAAVHGPALALAVGAGFAGAASIASFLRLLPNDPDRRPRRVDPIDIDPIE
ncbi:DHA2 family multidrug resistance protein-like MFS transporter [Inquilinus ginsengisoli]|uniref:DHA2 family multidrug resistance protein-like MFS transporter n=1 Tax=Inquilinus ginsengisoli TaxID=363840 RepID=A0ABU1JY98_9PROT|nr:MFS transporter [Inquilinus ginsengisoli]MDR6293591.1 DHA2 family multidrug resistance protein-like MFS transporter [Inquilinus ginsengisoli]